jgi:hypothetical protein
MARKIETDLIDALREGRDLKQANTTYDPRTGTVTLHGSAIAQREGDGWKFNLCGYNTPTTRSRLNAVARAYGLNGVFTRAGLPLVAGNAVPVNGWFYP